MFEGKEKRLALIAELKMTEEWRSTAESEMDQGNVQAYQENTKMLNATIEKVLDGITESI